MTRPVARGGGCGGGVRQICQKVAKNGPNWGFCRRVKGGEVQKSTFKGPLFGDSRDPLSQIDSGYEPEGDQRVLCLKRN